MPPPPPPLPPPPPPSPPLKPLETKPTEGGSDSSLSGGAIAAIVCGGVAVFVLLVLLVLLVLGFRRQSTQLGKMQARWHRLRPCATLSLSSALIGLPGPHALPPTHALRLKSLADGAHSAGFEEHHAEQR